MHADEEPPLGELIEIPAHGLGGDLELRGEVGDGDTARAVQDVEDLSLAFAGVQGVTCLIEGELARPEHEREGADARTLRQEPTQNNTHLMWEWVG